MPRRYISNKFLSPDVIDESIHTVHRLAELDGQRVALAGGIAMQIYGSDRLTADIDIIAESPIPGVPVEGDLALIPGYTGRLPNGVQIDVIVPETDGEWYDLFDHARGYARPLEPGGIPVVSREYLIALKMMASRGDKDIGDLYFLLTAPETNLVQARSIVREELGKFAAKEFDALVEEANWAVGKRRPRKR